MNAPSTIKSLLPLIACTLASHAGAQVLTNGGFESGFSGWTTADQIGSDGSFFVQQGTQSPVNGFTVPAPPQGARAAMTDAGAGGSHILYQDFVVPAGITSASVGFSLFLKNGADAYFTPATLDWAQTNPQGGTNLNQQARVDLMLASADAFSIDPAAVLVNLFQTTTASPLFMDYTSFTTDITALLQAHAGQTLRLRFAETDNVNFFNLGVDNVTLVAIPAPAAWSVAFLSAALLGRRRR